MKTLLATILLAFAVGCVSRRVAVLPPMPPGAKMVGKAVMMPAPSQAT